MDPIILFPWGFPERACLVDLESQVMLRRRGDKSKELHRHYMAAVSIGLTEAGEFDMTTDVLVNKSTREHVHYQTTVLNPRPCVLREGSVVEYDRRPIGSRKILPEAAKVLLQLAEAANNATTRHSRGTWDFGEPVERDPETEVKWSKWGLYAAWMWSQWQALDVSTKEQWEAMRRIGYPHKEGTLRTLITDKLGLVPLSRTQAEQNPWNRTSEA